jgi:hypothetical protein
MLTLTAFLPLTIQEQEGTAQVPIGMFLDRDEYWDSDPSAQIVICFGGTATASDVVDVQLQGPAWPQLAALRIVGIETRKLDLRLALQGLGAGVYVLSATLTAGGVVQSTVQGTVNRVAVARAAAAWPKAGVLLTVGPAPHAYTGPWGISFGLPLPEGAVKDLRTLALLENGKAIPAAFQLRSTWHPEYPGGRVTARWVIVQFVAYFDKGAPPSYRVVTRRSARPARAGVRVSETSRFITIDNGALSFVVRKKGFSGIEKLDVKRSRLLGPVRVVSGRGGPYIVDQHGKRYESRMDAKSEVAVEELTSVRARIVARGWYTDTTTAGASPPRLCQYVVRIDAYAREPFVRVSHRTILTFVNADNTFLSDIGWHTALVRAKGWEMGGDGRTFGGPLTANARVHLVQRRSREFLLREDTATRRLVAAGVRSDGWCSAVGSGFRVSAILRDVYQKFPKELEVVGGPRTALVVHTWPAHGEVVFGQAEQLRRDNIYKLWFAHHGSVLDTRLPAAYATELRRLHSNPGAPDEMDSQWDQENPTQIALGENGDAQGTCLGADFLLYPSRVVASDVSSVVAAKLAQDSPHALANPAWNAQSGVMGRVSAERSSDPVDQRLAKRSTGYESAIVNQFDEHGTWIYGDTHDKWDPSRGVPNLHRVWQASHYRVVATAWVSYFRSASPAALRWARAASGHLMDVSINNYSDDRTTAHNTQGSVYHCKGFTPWGSDSAPVGHHIDADGVLFPWLIADDPRARDLVDLWFGAIGAIAKWDVTQAGWGREANPILGEVLSYYQATWDPQALIYIRLLAKGIFAGFWDAGLGRFTFRARTSGSFEPFSHTLWHRQWCDRLFQVTRDGRSIALVRDYIAEGFGTPSALAFAWHHVRTPAGQHDHTYLTRYFSELIGEDGLLYEKPGDRYDGYSTIVKNYSRYWLEDMYYYLDALRQAGLTVAGGARESIYPGSRKDVGNAVPSVRVLVLEPPGDAGFTVNCRALLSYGEIHPGVLKVFAPDGTMLADISYTHGTSSAPGGISVPVPAGDGQVGLYRIEARSHQVQFLAPLTTLPEAGVLLRGERAWAMDRQDWFMVARDPAAVAVIEIRGGAGKYGVYHSDADPAHFSIRDALGALVHETTVFAYANQPSVLVRLDPVLNPGPWRLFSSSRYGSEIELVSGPNELYIAGDPTALAQVVAAL